VELSYLAFSRFCWDPDLTWERFVAEDVAPLLGGPEAAGEFIAIAEELDANQRLDLKRLDALQSRALAGLSNGSGPVARRWLSLADQIARRRHMGC